MAQSEKRENSCCSPCASFARSRRTASRKRSRRFAAPKSRSATRRKPPSVRLARPKRPRSARSARPLCGSSRRARTPSVRRACASRPRGRRASAPAGRARAAASPAGDGAAPRRGRQEAPDVDACRDRPRVVATIVGIVLAINSMRQSDEDKAKKEAAEELARKKEKETQELLEQVERMVATSRTSTRRSAARSTPSSPPERCGSCLGVGPPEGTAEAEVRDGAAHRRGEGQGRARRAPQGREDLGRVPGEPARQGLLVTTTSVQAEPTGAEATPRRPSCFRPIFGPRDRPAIAFRARVIQACRLDSKAR